MPFDLCIEEAKEANKQPIPGAAVVSLETSSMATVRR
jgi:hypothetical protein